MNPYKQIDFVFLRIKEQEKLEINISTEYIWNIFVSKRPELEINRMIYDEIIRRLVEDRYLTETPSGDSSQNFYHLTFNGRLFEGYEKEKELSDLEKKRLLVLEEESRQNQKKVLLTSEKMNLLTLILAVGTIIAALYYLLEILNHWFCIYPKH